MLLSASEPQCSNVALHLCQPRPHVTLLWEWSEISECLANDLLNVLKMVDMCCRQQEWQWQRTCGRIVRQWSSAVWWKQQWVSMLLLLPLLQRETVISMYPCTARIFECCVLLLLLPPSGAVACKEHTPAILSYSSIHAESQGSDQY